MQMPPRFSPVAFASGPDARSDRPGCGNDEGSAIDRFRGKALWDREDLRADTVRRDLFPRRHRPPVKQFRCARGTLIRRIVLRGIPERRRLMSALVTFLGCGLVLAGFAAERFAECRWFAASGPAPLDACAVLALALPAVGLTLMATSAA